MYFKKNYYEYKFCSQFTYSTTATTMYFLVCKKKKPVDFDDELKIGDV